MFSLAVWVYLSTPEYTHFTKNRLKTLGYSTTDSESQEDLQSADLQPICRLDRLCLPLGIKGRQIGKPIGRQPDRHIDRKIGVHSDRWRRSYRWAVYMYTSTVHSRLEVFISL